VLLKAKRLIAANEAMRMEKEGHSTLLRPEVDDIRVDDFKEIVGHRAASDL
jgi:hypothetical protein